MINRRTLLAGMAAVVVASSLPAVAKVVEHGERPYLFAFADIVPMKRSGEKKLYQRMDERRIRLQELYGVRLCVKEVRLDFATMPAFVVAQWQLVECIR